MPEFANVVLLDHPLIQHKLTLLRCRETATAEFRRLVREISMLMAYELTRDLPLTPVAIETPLEPTMAPLLAGKKLCLVSILRAGNGMLEGMLDLVPSARVGHFGLYRNPATLIPVDPMLATGQSVAAALARLREAGARLIRLACLLAAPEGLSLLAAIHPAVTVYTAAIDRQLDVHGYIRPGLGDAGDRLYGTR